MVLSIFWTNRVWNILQTLPLTNQLHDTGLSWSKELQIAWEGIQENYHMQYRTQNLFYSGKTPAHWKLQEVGVFVCFSYSFNQ